MQSFIVNSVAPFRRTIRRSSGETELLEFNPGEPLELDAEAVGLLAKEIGLQTIVPDDKPRPRPPAAPRPIRDVSEVDFHDPPEEFFRIRRRRERHDDGEPEPLRRAWLWPRSR